MAPFFVFQTTAALPLRRGLLVAMINGCCVAMLGWIACS